MAGSVFETPAATFTGATRVEVIEVNVSGQFAKIRLVHTPAFEAPSLGGIIFGGIDRGGSGHIYVGGKFIPIPPHSPFIQVLDQIAVHESSEAIASVQIRNAVRREALSAIASHVENQMRTLQTFRQPAPSLQIEAREGEPSPYRD